MKFPIAPSPASSPPATVALRQHALVDLLDKKRKVEISLNGPNLLWGMDILKGRASKPPRGAETVPSDDEHLLPSQS